MSRPASDPLRPVSGARYEVLERLGSGAHGEGYLAQRLSDGERVFLKVLKPELSGDGEWARRFCDEVTLLRACLHPNIVRYVEAYRQESGELCLVTEFLEGEDLKARLRKSGPLAPRHVLSLALPLCNALEFLHGRDVVHRDLTPENVFVSGRFPEVVPRLLDFGLAWSAGPRQAKTGASLALTPLYAAPECLAGERATAASDIYSLGVILFEALSGAPPFAANSVEALLDRQREGKLPSLPERSQALAPVLRRCLAARPEDRWVSAGELARALQSAVEQTPGEVAVARPKPAAAPGALGTVGNYELIRELGKGGMGEVYLARHTRLGRQVAIKMLHADAMKDRDAVARFFNEARTVNAINHEHIVEIFDFVEEDGANPRTYCVMELLVGHSLAQLRKKSPLPLRRLLHICRQVADALAAAHRAGVVHRDIKPGNIFVTTRSGLADFVKVLDFGVAKVNLPLPGGGEETPSINTQTGLSLGTPDYMSPEQVTAAPVDGRTDVFALGVMIYELLAGFRPFVGANVAHLVVKVVREPHTPLPEVSAAGEPIPTGLRRLVDRCLEKRREDRPQTMEEVSASIERLLQELAAPATTTMVAPRVSETVIVEPPSAPAPTRTSPSPAPVEAATEAQPSNISALLPAAPRRNLGAIAVGVGVLAIAGALAVTRMAPSVTPPASATSSPRAQEPAPEKVTSPAPTVTPAVPAAPAQQVPAASAAPSHPEAVALSVVSTPAGARVVRADTGERLGTTPLKSRLAYGAEPVTLRLELDGHASQEAEVLPARDIEVNVRLSQLVRERTAPARKAPVKKKPAKEDPDAPLDPFAGQ